MVGCNKVHHCSDVRLTIFKQKKEFLFMKIIKLLALMSLVTQHLLAQTLTDGLMMPKKNLCTGFMYSTDSWKNYWEGSLKRDNLNIGTLTINSTLWVGSYGLTKKINLIAMV